MRRRLVLWLFGIIIIAGIGLRSYQLTARSLWFDEAFSWRLIQFPTTEMIARDAADVHPPLYYLILKVWATVFGSSLLALRAFSVTLAAATIAAAYLFTASAFRTRVGALLAALLVAVSGFQIQFAWEARMYTLGTALALLSAWLLLRAIRAKPQRVSWWLAYAVAVAAFAYVHYFAFFTIAAQLLFLVGYIVVATRGRLGEILQWRLVWYALVAGVVILVLYAPWLGTFLEQRSRVEAAFWIPPLSGWSVPDTFYKMYIPTVDGPPHDTWLGVLLALGPLAVTTGAWLLWGLRGRRYEVSDGIFLALSCGLVPFILSVVLSLVSKSSVYQDRYLLFAQLFIMVMWAHIFSRLRWRATGTIVVLVACVGLLASDLWYWRDLNILARPGARAAAQTIFTGIARSEPVVVSSPFVFFAIDHYAQENYGLSGHVKLYSESGELAHFAGGPILRGEDIVGQAFFTERDTQAVWVVDTTGFGAAPLQLSLPWQVAEHETYPEVFGYQGTVSTTRYIR